MNPIHQKPTHFSARNTFRVLYRTACALLLLLSALSIAEAQTFRAAGGPIPDAGPEVSFPVVVSGLSAQHIDSTFGIQTVCLNIHHTYDADLSIRLKSPSGTIVNLSVSNGGAGHDYINTCFNQGAQQLIASAGAPFTGTFRPFGNLGDFNNGQPGNGIWYMLVQDQGVADTGSLIDFSISFGVRPAVPFRFDSTNLPLVQIFTDSLTIVDSPKVPVRMQIIDRGNGRNNRPSDSVYAYKGAIGIEYRGSSSSTFPQKSYGFETRDSSGAVTDVELLGMPAEHDWILYAPYDDKSLMRDALTYRLWRDMGRYATDSRFCELFLDGHYQGIYLIMEKIKRDNHRVDIAKLKPTDTVGDNLTGGYILKVDKTTGTFTGGWNSPYPPAGGNGTQTTFFQVEYPKAADLQPVQQAYIKNYVALFENALHGPQFTDSLQGWRNYADAPSHIDYFLMNELTHNVDGLRLSYYFYKDKESKGGKLKAGPVWDYNLAWRNADYCDGFQNTGWAYNFGRSCPTDGYQIPFWWQRFLQDPVFTDSLKCRWHTLRTGPLSNQRINRYIDSTSAVLNQAQARHFTCWPILGVYTWPNPSPLANTYAEELAALKYWISVRLNWLDTYLPGICPAPVSAVSQTQPSLKKLMLFPNPVSNRCNLQFTAPVSGPVSVSLYNAQGSSFWVKQIQAINGSNSAEITLDSGNLPEGIYWLKLTGNGFSLSEKLVYKKD